ncbi:ABC transporter ATP-binding protein [Bifidobacterium sp. ESL0732]|uniref:ABC transporter ATP-binding protein n=1 Tax=Bifidobacterium sp. ESL0732 TaxID=2983222 RepID=UPI0023F6D5D1|nr:ABC transporter ATP-binding protein [Bifidobacterium sp. ESL0732]WEV63466.1 ABC transporter ATP-binding protein [Bifidobacterium sp. ESL0732]
MSTQRTTIYQSSVDTGSQRTDGSVPSVMADGLSMTVSPRKGDSVTILKDVDFRAYPGQMTAIVGPSGSGKSTLLYCLAGLETFTKGTVTLLGTPINGMKPTKLTKFRRNHMGFVFQSYNLVASMSVEENLALPFTLRASRFPRKKAQSILDYFGLGRQRKASVTELSGGEQQRVALARVLLTSPDIIFADEPTGALDQVNGRKVIEVLRDVARDPKKTVVMVTHSPEIAKQCDRIVEVRDGRIAQAAWSDDPRSEVNA